MVPSARCPRPHAIARAEAGQFYECKTAPEEEATALPLRMSAVCVLPTRGWPSQNEAGAFWNPAVTWWEVKTLKLTG